MAAVTGLAAAVGVGLQREPGQVAITGLCGVAADGAARLPEQVLDAAEDQRGRLARLWGSCGHAHHLLIGSLTQKPSAAVAVQGSALPGASSGGDIVAAAPKPRPARCGGRDGHRCRLIDRVELS